MRWIHIFLILCGFAYASNMGAVTGGSSADVGNGIFFNSDLITAAQNVKANGAVIKADTGVTFDFAGNGNGDRNFAKAGVGTDAIVGMYALITGTNITSGYYEITGIAGDDSWVNCADIVATDDNANSTLDIGGACPILGGGGTVGNFALQEVFDDALGSAAANNVEIYTTGDATLTATIAKDVGGGTPLFFWSWYGCDSSYVRVVPTRTAVGGGIANSLLDTSGMPVINCSTFMMNIGGTSGTSTNYLLVDGIAFTGTSTDLMVGSDTGDFIAYTNCSIMGTGTATGSRALELDNECSAVNCDITLTGGSAASIAFDSDNQCRAVNCISYNTSSSSIATAISSLNGTFVNCLIYDTPGRGIFFTSNNSQNMVVNCTFENVVAAITTENSQATPMMVIVNNIAKDCTTGFLTNGHSATQWLIAQYNHFNNNGYDYDPSPAFIGLVGFQDLASDPLFVNEGTDDYNLQNGSPANSQRPFSPGGAMDVVAGAGGGGGVVGVVWN